MKLLYVHNQIGEILLRASKCNETYFIYRTYNFFIILLNDKNKTVLLTCMCV